MAQYEVVELEKFAPNFLFLPTTKSAIWRQFEFPAAQYFVISKQKVRPLRGQSKTFKTSVHFFLVIVSKAEQNDKFIDRVWQNG